MPDLSMPAGLLLYSLFNLIGLIFMIILYLDSKRYRKINAVFLVFFILNVTGSILLSYRDTIGVFFGITIANSMLIAGHMFLLIAVRQLLSKRNNLLYIYGSFVIFLIIFSLFTYIDDNLIARVHLYNLFAFAYTFLTLLSLCWNRKRCANMNILIYILIIKSLFILTRMIRFIFWPESSNDFLAFSFDSYFIVLNGFINVLLLSGLLSVVYGFVNQELNENERIKSSLLANLPGFAFRCKNDDNWTMIYVSDSFKDLTGYDKEQIINNKEISYEQLIRSSFREEVRLGWEQTFELNTKYSAEYQLTIADGSHIWVWEQSTPTIDKDTNEVIIEGFIADIAARKEIEENLEYLSFHDVLTGLYNRRYIEDKLVEFDHQNTYPISVIMADINGLKFINDSFGHNYGDEVIVETGRIFSEVIGEDNYISRLSGDEFLAILPNIDFNETKMLVDRIHEQINLIRKDRFNLSVAIGYASKVSPTQSLNNIRIIAEDNMYQQKVYEKPSNRRKTVDAVLGTLFEKDTLSEQHSRNVANYSKKLAQAAGLNQSMINQTETAALLHDVGKIIIDTAILTSPNRLSLEEYNEIKKHPEIGYRILNNVPELQKIAEIILCHHERIDGKGYPRYLKGDKIPYISKIISICDAYDAMVNKRYYRSPIGKNEAFAELKRNAGTQFDSELVDIFIEVFQ